MRSAGEVLEMAREYLGPSHPFNPEEHPPWKRELWVDSDKKRFIFHIGTLVGEGWRERDLGGGAFISDKCRDWRLRAPGRRAGAQ